MLKIKEMYSSYYKKLSTCYPTSDIYLSLWDSNGLLCESGNCKIGKEKSNCASISKLFTFLAFGIAEKRQLLSIDTTVGAIIPELRLYYSDEKMTNSITIEMLLRHSSGLPQFARYGNIFTPENNLKQHIYSLDETELLFYPGTDSCYSNLNFDLLSYILELVFGCTYERILSEQVFSAFLKKIDYGFSINNRSQMASLGIELSPNSLMYIVSKAFGSMHDQFFSDFIWNEYSNYVRLADKQNYGQGLCCKVFMISGIPCCYLTGQFIDKYICLAWNSEKNIYHLFFVTKCSQGLINFYHGNDLFCGLLDPQWSLMLENADRARENSQYYSVKDRIGLFKRYISCDNQVLEIMKRDNSVIVFHNLHYVGEFDLVDCDNLIGENLLIKCVKKKNEQRLLVLFNGETKWYYEDYVSFEDNNVFLQYEPVISEHADPMERFLLRFLKSNLSIFVSLTDKELIINNLIHYRKHKEKYYSSAGAVASAKRDEIYVNNLAFVKNNKNDFEVEKIRNVVRI